MDEIKLPGLPYVPGLYKAFTEDQMQAYARAAVELNRQKPMADDQIVEIAQTPAAVPGSYIHAVIRAVEAHHGIKEPT